MDKSKGFGHYLDRTVKAIQIAYQTAFKQMEIDLTIEQWVFLQQIYELGDKASQRELTNLNFRTRGTTSKMIANLANMGYVRKSRFKNDLKRFKLSLMPKGKRIIEKLLPFVKELRAIGYKNHDPAEFDIFLKVLNQIWENYNEKEALEQMIEQS